VTRTGEIVGTFSTLPLAVPAWKTDGGSFSISADTPTRRGPVEVVDLEAST